MAQLERENARLRELTTTIPGPKPAERVLTAAEARSVTALLKEVQARPVNAFQREKEALVKRELRKALESVRIGLKWDPQRQRLINPQTGEPYKPPKRDIATLWHTSTVS